MLECSEKELLSASEDVEGRRAEQLAKKYLRLSRNYRLVQYILYGALTGGCLMGNLIAGHNLTWFWIVLAAEAMVASLTLLPVFVPEGRRGAACFGGFAGCLVVLLGVCCLYTGGDWFPLAALGSLFGLGLAFLPLVLRSLPLPEGLAHRKAALYVGIELVLLFALLGAACLDSRGTWFVSAVVWTLFGAGAFLLPPLLPQLPLPAGWQRHKALVYFSWETLLLLLGLAWEGRNGDFPLPMLPMALLCLTLPWGWLGAVRYLPGSRWVRVGLGLVWTGLWVWLAPFALDRVLLASGWISSQPYDLRLPFDLTNWGDSQVLSANVLFLIILGAVAAGGVCLAVGLARRRRR